MQALASQISNALSQQIRAHTLYDLMRSSRDFEDVKSALNDRTDWSIELFRSCFTIHLSDSGSFFMLCALSFLVAAESIHIHYGRLPAAGLKERVESMGYGTFATLFAVLDIGCIVVRVAGLVALSKSPGLGVSLALVSMSLPGVLPSVSYMGQLVFRWRKRGPRGSGVGEVESENV